MMSEGNRLICNLMKLHWLILLLQSPILLSAEENDIFAKPENLKVLPEDISPQSLRETMKLFAMSLGVRCQACHLGEPGKPLSSFDFSSDDKPLKRKARVMLKMVQNINQVQLPKLDAIDKSERVEVSCMSCHRGQQKPLLIQDVLADTFFQNGISGVIDKYSELREKYHGSHTYDFSTNMLPMFSQAVLSAAQYQDDAVRLLEVNAEYFPDSWFAYFSLGSAYHQAGKLNSAALAYGKALKLNPEARFVEKRLNSLKK